MPMKTNLIYLPYSTPRPTHGYRLKNFKRPLIYIKDIRLCDNIPIDHRLNLELHAYVPAY